AMAIDIAALLQPVSESAPCGEDVSFSEVYDRIREERRADDPSLSQGEWQTELKTANWRNVIELSSQVLSRQSKDLQAAVWLGEALISRDGFAGVADACNLLEGLMSQFWDGLYPLADGEDLEERVSRLAWFNQYATHALRSAPLTRAGPAVSLNDWQTSREVDNLARQNREAWQAAIDEGKSDGETFNQALRKSGRDAIIATLASLDQVLCPHKRLDAQVNTRFGRQAPSLTGIGEVLEQARQIMIRTAKELGVPAPTATDVINEEVGRGHSMASNSPNLTQAVADRLILTSPALIEKQDALRQLREIADFFRTSEPHSPVAYLLERAMAWANMPLDEWLSEVVDDEGLLARIREKSGMQAP
ncbi:MAG: type VI secretion system protein TssA, partial [Pseudomonas sp.]